MRDQSAKSLKGTRVAITRPAGAGTAMMRRVRAFGGGALSLPGSSLHAIDNAKMARASLRAALTCDVLIFSSPAAVRFAARLSPLRTRAAILAPGRGTASALRRAGCDRAIVPARADSEGLLALPILQRVRGKRIGIVGAPGGRGVLEGELATCGAKILHAHVYQRVPARLDRRHARALLRTRAPLYVPLSSVETIGNLLASLPDAARCALLAGTAIVSSDRLRRAARTAGFARALRARSASDADLIEAVIAAHAKQR